MDTELLHTDSSAEVRALPSFKAEATRLLHLATNTQQTLFESGLCSPCFEGLAYLEPEKYLSLLKQPDVQIASQEIGYSGLTAIAITLEVAPDIAVPAFLSMMENHRDSHEVLEGAGPYIDWLLSQGKLCEVVDFAEQRNPWSSMGRVIDAVAQDGNSEYERKLTAIFDKAIKKSMPEDRTRAYRWVDRFAKINAPRALAWVKQAFDETYNALPTTFDGIKRAAIPGLSGYFREAIFDYTDRPARLAAAESLFEGRLMQKFPYRINEFLIRSLVKNNEDFEKHDKVIEVKARLLAMLPGDLSTRVNIENKHICIGLLESIPYLARQTPMDDQKIDKILTFVRNIRLDNNSVSMAISKSLPALIPLALHRLEIFERDFSQWLIIAPALLDNKTALTANEYEFVNERYFDGLCDTVITQQGGLALKEIARRYPTAFNENYQHALHKGVNRVEIQAALGEYVYWDTLTTKQCLEQAIASTDFCAHTGAMEALEKYYPHDPEWTLQVIENTLANRNHPYVKEKARKTLSAIVHGLVVEVLDCSQGLQKRICI